jgi:hypothetical protein
VSQRRFSHDAEPIEHPSRRGDCVRDWLTLLLPFLIIACAMVMVLWFLWQALTMPIRPASDSPMISAADSSASPSLPVCETPMPLSTCIYMGNISSTPVTAGAAKRG